ncbi:MAG: ABC transporter ATP-binding protein [Limosilactobacillus gorillae]|jgi:ABC-2 type transport system ATP-binding protein|uniref:ABC transporter ATP-binding protein n=1 Tax=Limosilactobacillus gorillae TaxID=1450649 RepID=UPI000A43EBD9|nr:ABC transporter ATP-binding protein [Limosilactobacillus gorillae]MDO4855667.1 ABC transporter ATP-binding protein [Limosilactobacillus gorillae]
MILEINDLVGGYSRVPVLKKVSFNVEEGQLVGLIGLNGAGKSTTINHVIGLLQPFSGAIKVGGKLLKEDAPAYKAQIAYIPETPILYDELTLKEHLELTIQAYQMDEQAAWKRAERLLKLFRLDNKLDWFPVDFSKGMRQKVMIVAAFMTEARLLVIDEPFYGLDPLAVHDLLDLIQEKKKQGVGILMSTHVLETAQRYCDRFVILADGRVKSQGSLADLTKNGQNLDEVYLNLARDEQHG